MVFPVKYHPPSWKVAHLMELQGGLNTFDVPDKKHLDRGVSTAAMLFS